MKNLRLDLILITLFCFRNYDAELFAFGKRLGEEFPLETLRRAFLHSSYEPEIVEDETAVQSEMENVPTSSNEEFIIAGKFIFMSLLFLTHQSLIFPGDKLIKTYVTAYLRYHFPKLPEEGIR